ARTCGVIVAHHPTLRDRPTRFNQPATQRSRLRRITVLVWTRSVKGCARCPASRRPARTRSRGCTAPARRVVHGMARRCDHHGRAAATCHGTGDRTTRRDTGCENPDPEGPRPAYTGAANREWQAYVLNPDEYEFMQARQD